MKDKQLCWMCARTDGVCSWADGRFILPKGAKTDDEGYIIECPLYTVDEYRIHILPPVAEMAKALGISTRTFYRTRKSSTAEYKRLVGKK